MRTVRNLIIVAVVAVVAFVVFQGISQNGDVTAQEAGQENSLIQDETLVSVSDLEVTVNATGSVEPARKVGLVFEMSNLPVAEVIIEEGQQVDADALLAYLDTADMETNLRIAEINLARQRVAYDALVEPAREVDVRVAEAALAAAQAGVNAAFDTGTDAYDREIARLQAELARNALWQQQLQRDQTLNPQVPEGFPEPVIPLEVERQLEAGLAQADFGVLIADENFESVAGRGPDVGSLGSANASVVAAEVQLERLLEGPSAIDLQRAEIQLRQAELARDLAQVNLDRARLYAPFDGVVAAVNLTEGELPPSATAVEIIDDSVFYIDLAIDETEIVDVQVGQPVSLVLDALPEAQITGTITRVAQTPTRIGQVVTYIARVTLDPTLEPVRLGMNATATIKVQQLEDVFTLRNRFIRIDRSTQRAFVTVQRENGRFEEIEVQLGLRNETHSQILSGLEAGQRIVLLPRGELNVFGDGG